SSLLSLAPNVVNRVSPVFIEFPPYDAEGAKSILLDRANAGLQAGTWNHMLLEQISAMSNGDARVAIQTLRSAAHMADSDARGFVEQKHVQAAFEKAQDLRRRYRLKKLTAHHRIIYDIVKERKKVTMREVEKEYNTRVKEYLMGPVSKRSFCRYIEVMKRMRLLRGDKSRVFGNVVQLEAVE
ncbi:MAG: hypothetical protein JXA57_14160, partial [Armatimonadetes bacterium]|nr:hypothetical protein [Armatimonadota bacterium]